MDTGRYHRQDRPDRGQGDWQLLPDEGTLPAGDGRLRDSRIALCDATFNAWEKSGAAPRWYDGPRRHTQPSSFIAKPECQIFVTGLPYYSKSRTIPSLGYQ